MSQKSSSILKNASLARHGSGHGSGHDGALAENPNPVADAGSVSEAEVLHYLVKHPEFFEHHMETLRLLSPREEWSNSNMIDLQSVMIDRSREAMRDLREAARSVIEISRMNMALQARTHEASLVLMEADGLDAVVRVLREQWAAMLDVEVVAIGFEYQRAPLKEIPHPEVVSLPPGLVREMLGVRLNTRLFAEPEPGAMILFGADARRIESLSLSRLDLGPSYPQGLLGLAGKEGTFEADQETDLLQFLTRTLVATLKRWIVTDA